MDQKGYCIESCVFCFRAADKRGPSVRIMSMLDNREPLTRDHWCQFWFEKDVAVARVEYSSDSRVYEVFSYLLSSQRMFFCRGNP